MLEEFGNSPGQAKAPGRRVLHITRMHLHPPKKDI